MGIKLSIIIPTLDGAIRAKIPECEGVEVVVVKGVSPVGKARNEGLRRAKGEYIAWVDSDDEVSEEWIGEILHNLKGCEAGRGAPDVITFDVRSDKLLKTTEWGRWMKSGKCAADRLAREIYRDCALVNALWMYVSRRELWEGIRFDESISRGEDYLVIPQVMARARAVEYIPKTLYHYRENPTSVMHQEKSDHQRQYMELSVRRYEAAPKFCRGAARFGVGMEMYWLLNAVALGKNPDCPTEVLSFCRGWIRRHLMGLVFGTLLDGELKWRDRVIWPIKFMVAAQEAWWFIGWRKEVKNDS